MGFFLDKDGKPRNPFDIAAMILMMPIGVLLLVPSLLFKRGRLSGGDIDSFAEALPSMLYFGIIAFSTWIGLLGFMVAIALLIKFLLG